MHPYHFSFDGSHPGLGVKEKCVVSAPYVLVGCSCRAAASFNKSLQPTFDPSPIFAAAKTYAASNAPELKR
jgi:hypothetical protein